MLTILLVEDQEDIREIVREQITTNFKRVTFFEARNPIEALEIFNRNKNTINYLICDYYLPIQNGDDFLEIVKRERPPIVVTLYTADQEIKKEDHPLADTIFYKQDGVKPIVEHIKSTMMNIYQI